MSDTNNSRYDAENSYENYSFLYFNGHSEWLEQARRNVDFFFSRQWDPKDIADNRAGGRPSLTINIIESLVRAQIGIQRALRNDVRFAPVSDAGIDDAQVQDSLWMHTASQNDLDSVESELWLHGLLTGRGYYDARTIYDDNMRGQIKIKPKRSQDVVLDTIDSYDPADWGQLYISGWDSLTQIEYWFGKDVADSLACSDMPGWYSMEDQMMAQRMGRLPYFSYLGFPDSKLRRGYRRLERQYVELKRRDVFIDTKTGDIQPVPKGWDRERIGHLLQEIPRLSTIKRQVKVYKSMVSYENEVVFHEEMPDDGFTIVPFFFTFFDGETFSAVDPLIDPQRLYNKMTSKELEIISTTSNSGYKVVRGGLLNMSIDQLQRRGSMNGIVLEVKEENSVSKLETNALPAGHDSLSKKAEAIMRNQSSMGNAVRGMAREDVSGDAIELNNAALSINFAGPLHNLHRTKQLLAKRCQALWQSNYDEERMIMINRGTTYRPEYDQIVLNGTSPEGETFNDITKGEYTTVLVPSPARFSMTSDELAQLIELKKLGLQIPDDTMIELLNIPNKSQLIQKMKGDSNAKAQADEQRAQEEHQQQQQVMQADIQKKGASAQLDQARAAKAQGEAGKDPDAAYVEVEMTRIAQQAKEFEETLKLEWATEQRERVEGQRDHAVKIAQANKPSPSKGLTKRQPA